MTHLHRCPGLVLALPQPRFHRPRCLASDKCHRMFFPLFICNGIRIKEHNTIRLHLTTQKNINICLYYPLQPAWPDRDLDIIALPAPGRSLRFVWKIIIYLFADGKAFVTFPDRFSNSARLKWYHLSQFSQATMGADRTTKQSEHVQ